MLLTELKSLIAPNQFDKQGTPMKYPNVYTHKNIGASKKVRPETVVVKDSKTGKIYGRRTLFQKST